MSLQKESVVLRQAIECLEPLIDQLEEHRDRIDYRLFEKTVEDSGHWSKYLSVANVFNSCTLYEYESPPNAFVYYLAVHNNHPSICILPTNRPSIALYMGPRRSEGLPCDFASLFSVYSRDVCFLFDDF